MSELMSMMRQLTQTRTADVGQREEESGGTGRGAAHNYSGIAIRVPSIADTSYGATVVGATAVAEVPVHSRAASEPGRPADDTSRRPVLPAGVGPMIDVQRREARVLRLVCTSGLLVRNAFPQQHCLLFKRVPSWYHLHSLAYEMVRNIQHIAFQEELLFILLKTSFFRF